MDGEIVPYKEGRILEFAILQNRLGRKVLSADFLNQIPCRYFAFDLLYLIKICFWMCRYGTSSETAGDVKSSSECLFDIGTKNDNYLRRIGSLF